MVGKFSSLNDHCLWRWKRVGANTDKASAEGDNRAREAHEGSEELQESWEYGSPHTCLGLCGHLEETCKGPEPMTLLDLKAEPTEVQRKETSAIWLSVEENHEAIHPSSSHNSKWEKLKSDPTPRLSKEPKGKTDLRTEDGREYARASIICQ